MIKKIDTSSMIQRHLGWFYGNIHFASTDYIHPNKMHYGVLRTVDDVYIQPKSGFKMHPHKDIEIITYIVDGELTHHDSLGHRNTGFAGDAFYMSAGIGISHEEHNNSDNLVHLLQIWVVPDKKNLEPKFSHAVLPMKLRDNKLLHLVSGESKDAKIKINQDVDMYVIKTNEPFELPIDDNRQIYIVQIEGSSQINNFSLEKGDALEGDNDILNIIPTPHSHFIIIEMKKNEN